MSPVSPWLQIALLWNERVIGYQLLAPKGVVTLGEAAAVSFAVPRLEGYPKRLRLLTPVKDGYRLRLGPGMRGRVALRGQVQEVGQILAQPAPRRRFGAPGMFREVELYPGDEATLGLEIAPSLRFQITFTEPPAFLPRPPGLRAEPLLLRTSFGTLVATLVAAIVVFLVGHSDEPTMEITKERFAKVVAPVLTSPRMQAVRERTKAADEAKKQKAREAAEAKRAKGERGRLGRQDAPSRDSILPKGQQDVLREKVAKTGLLAALGREKAPGSGLGKLLDPTSTDLDQAMTGLVGAQLVAGKGSGGLGNVGAGTGGGGKGFGRIQGSGELDVGAGRGRGRKGPGLGTGKEKEVQVGFETGSPDASGGLTKDQINRVVRAHAAAVRYCYEKELQRAPSLNGRVDLFWVIRANGAVDRTKIAASTLGNKSVESCIERQIKNWQFPKSDAETIVQSYPFLFKGGA